jgi:hypothetical protein
MGDIRKNAFGISALRQLAHSTTIIYTPDRPGQLFFDNTVLPLIFFSSPLATSVAPRLTPFFVAIIGLALIIPALRRGLSWHELLPWQPALGICLLFAAYVFLNSLWSVDPLAGLGKATLLVGLILITFAAAGAIPKLNKDSLRRASMAFVAGALLGACFILVELLSGGIVTRTVTAWLPYLTPTKHFKIRDGVVVALRLSKLDQNANMAMFHLWPGLLATMSLSSARRTIVALMFFAIIAVVIFLSEHDSSQVALIVSALVVMMAWKWQALVIRAMAVLWCAAFVFVIPATFVAYESGLHLANWLPKPARARVILWEYTAEQTLERPLLGVGADSTPRLSAQQKDTLTREQPDGFVYPRTMGHHGHSIFMQAWYELGAVGALLLAIAGAVVVLLILLLPASAQPFAAGAFAAFAVIGAFAWGMWQSWFMCAIALIPLYLYVTASGPFPSSELRSDTGPNPNGVPNATR